VLLGLLALVVLIVAGTVRGPVPPAVLSLPLLAGALLLGSASFDVLVAVTAAGLLVETVVFWPNAWIILGGLVVLTVAVLGRAYVRLRERLGVDATTGAIMLADLHGRLQGDVALPALPAGWHAEQEVRAAYGTQLSGDFVVWVRQDRHLEFAVVDVSGKGADAATRSLQLSGAFGGLLGAVAPAQFLPACNRYVVRQGWDGGFATAVHLVLDLDSGRCELRTAGHPPAIHHRAGAGVWVPVPTRGPLLGVVDDAAYPPEERWLARGDAVVVYTDGVVESPRRTLDDGVDRLLGEAEGLLREGLAGGARRLVERTVDDTDDDATLVLIWRS
jgi:hypothetical protein